MFLVSLTMINNLNLTRTINRIIKRCLIYLVVSVAFHSHTWIVTSSWRWLVSLLWFGPSGMSSAVYYLIGGGSLHPHFLHLHLLNRIHHASILVLQILFVFLLFSNFDFDIVVSVKFIHHLRIKLLLHNLQLFNVLFFVCETLFFVVDKLPTNRNFILIISFFILQFFI